MILLMEEIRRSPVEVGKFSHYLIQVSIHPRWLFGISSNSRSYAPFISIFSTESLIGNQPES